MPLPPFARSRAAGRAAAWLAAAALPLCVSAAEPAATNWMAAFVKGRKVGYSEESRVVQDGQVITREVMHLEVVRDGTLLVSDIALQTEETADGKPLGFCLVSSDSGGTTNRVEGRVGAAGKLRLRIVAAGRTKESEMDWPDGALLREGARLFALSQGLREGTAYTFRTFAPELIRALDCAVRVGPTAPVDLLGRTLTLTEVTETLESPSGAFSIRSWRDSALETHKASMSVLGAELEFLSCPRAFALGPNIPLDLLASTLVRSPIRLGAGDRAGALRYELAFEPGFSGRTLPETDEQKRLPPPGGSTNTVALAVRKLPFPTAVPRPYAGADPAARAALQPSRYIESDAPEIVALAGEAAGQETDAARAASRIEAFVRGHVKIKTLSVGYASALEAAKSRQGDCTEHAVLAAALCRAAGIPARVAFGLAYVDAFGRRERVFVPHAWTQVLLGERWISLDAAMAGFDAGHIALAVGNGEPDEFFGMLNMLGGFRIAAVEPDRKSVV